MNAPLTRMLLIAISVAATGATVMAVLPGSPAPVQAGPIAATTATEDTIVVLPAVQVTPEATPTLLATVTVRPDAMPGDGDLPDFATVVDYSSAAPGGGMGMPYYSFGKSMHRAYRE